MLERPGSGRVELPGFEPAPADVFDERKAGRPEDVEVAADGFVVDGGAVDQLGDGGPGLAFCEKSENLPLPEKCVALQNGPPLERGRWSYTASMRGCKEKPGGAVQGDGRSEPLIA